MKNTTVTKQIAQVALALVASLGTFFLIQIAVVAINSQLTPRGHIGLVVTTSLIGIAVGVVLTTIVAVALLPQTLRGRVLPALAIGMPVTLILIVLPLLQLDDAVLVNGRSFSAVLLLPAILCVLASAGVAFGTALLTRRRRARQTHLASA